MILQLKQNLKIKKTKLDPFTSKQKMLIKIIKTYKLNSLVINQLKSRSIIKLYIYYEAYKKKRLCKNDIRMG